MSMKRRFSTISYISSINVKDDEQNSDWIGRFRKIGVTKKLTVVTTNRKV